MKGYIYQVNDSSIVFAGVLPSTSVVIHKNDLYEIPFDNIDVIKIRRKGSVRKGILIGIGLGFFTGALIGFAEGDDDPGSWFYMTAEEKAIEAGIALAIVGGAAGGIVGYRKKKIYISGNYKLFNANRNKLLLYSFM